MGQGLDDGAGTAALAAVWKLVPVGMPVASWTDGIAQALTGVSGPRQAASAAVTIVGSDPAAAAGAAQVVKALAGEIDTLLHALAILAALPAVLEDGETVEAVSPAHDASGVRARNPLLPGGDVVTDRRVAEFAMGRWDARKSNGLREPKVVGDILKLATDPLVGGRRRYLYAAEGAAIAAWLARSRASVERLARVARQTGAWERLGRPVEVADLWAIVGPGGSGPAVEVVHLPDVVPELAGLFRPGAVPEA